MLHRSLFLRPPISSKLFACSRLPPTSPLYRNTAISNVLRLSRQVSTRRPAGVAQRAAATPKSSSLLKPREPLSKSKLLEERFRKFDHEISKTQPIFRAPPHRSYIANAYLTSMFCFFYAGYNFYTTAVDPIASIGKYQKYIFGGICVVMGGFGAIFLRRGTGLISSITATRSDKGTKLVINVRRMIPFLKQREIVTTPRKISLSRALNLPSKKLSALESMEVQKRLEAQISIDNIKFFKNPIKKTSLALWKIFQNAQRLFTQQFIVYLTVNGRKDALRLDSLGYFYPQYFTLQKAVIRDA